MQGGTARQGQMASALIATGVMLVSGCAAVTGRAPSEDEIRAAFAERHRRDVAALNASPVALPPEGLTIATVDADDCENDGDGEFHCPVTLVEERGAKRFTEPHVLVLVRAGDGWQLKYVE